MVTDPLQAARTFIDQAELPPEPVLEHFATRAPITFDEVKDQAAVVGSEVISFVKGVTAAERKDIINASLLAQLVARKQVPVTDTLKASTDWFNAYFDTLAHVGFVIQQQGFARYREASDAFDAHEAILKVAAGLLAGAPGALALITTTLEALKDVGGGKSWIKLWDRETRTAKAGRFQVSLAERGEGKDEVLVTLMAFAMEAKQTLAQVLFFKANLADVTLEHNSGKVSINAPHLAKVRDNIAAKLAAYTTTYIDKLPDL